MTDRELIDAFIVWRDGIDSVPYAHDALWTDVAAVAALTQEATR